MDKKTREKSKHRKLYINHEIDGDSANSIIEAIIEFNTEDNEAEQEIIDFERRPINIYINSPGGCVYSTLAIINAIEYSKTKIITHALGMVFSGALYVIVSGHERISHKYASFMFHQVHFEEPYANLEFIKNDVKEAERVQELLESIFKKKSKFPAKNIEEIITRSRDFYFDPKLALKFGVVDKII